MEIIDNCITCVIPVYNRDNERVQRCVDSIYLNNDGLVKEILVIDYSSDVIYDLKNCKVIRIENQLKWNKAHALNLGILKSETHYIMTVDCDMLLDKSHFKAIRENLKEDNFIIDTNVRRLPTEDINSNYEEMVSKSKPWLNNDRLQLINQANGGFQVYSRRFFDVVGGIMESLGFYLGGVDNYMYFIARLNGLNIVDLGIPLLHQEHPFQKEDNFKLTEKEKEFAKTYRDFKGRFLDSLIREQITRNIEPIGGEMPSDSLLKKFEYEWINRDAIIKKALDEGKTRVTLFGQVFKLERAKPKVLIAVINNYETMPSYFTWDLMNLYGRTRSFCPEVEIQQVNACDVNSMRNLAAKCALGMNEQKKVYDFVVMLDTDHTYHPDFIVRFLQLAEKNKYDIITGLTSNKKEPYRNTQYHKLITPIDTEENCVKSEKKDEIIQIEASGPVGMLIRTNVFRKINFPYYDVQYWKIPCLKCKGTKMMTENDIDLPCLSCDEKGEVEQMLGGDLYFCKQLKDAGIPINLDLNTSFPHEKRFFLSRNKVSEIEK